jgi:hypothetical protein
MVSHLLTSIKDCHAEPEDHVIKINRWLFGFLSNINEWSISDCLNTFRLSNSQKCSPSRRCLAIHNDGSVVESVNGVTIQHFGKLVNLHGGVRSQDAMLKDPDVEANYVRRNENHKGRKCYLIPQQLIKSEIWIQVWNAQLF